MLYKNLEGKKVIEIQYRWQAKDCINEIHFNHQGNMYVGELANAIGNFLKKECKTLQQEYDCFNQYFKPLIKKNTGIVRIEVI